LQEEKEKRLEEMFDGDLDNAFENKYVPKEEIPEEGAVAVAGKKTQETLTATDLIIERLDIAENEKKRIAEHQVILISLRALLFSKLMYYLTSDSARHV
jgi:U3 small nucleolar RNA-associated protein 12